MPLHSSLASLLEQIEHSLINICLSSSLRLCIKDLSFPCVVDKGQVLTRLCSPHSFEDRQVIDFRHSIGIGMFAVTRVQVYIMVYIPDTPCMPYMPRLGWFWGSLYVNMAYMECHQGVDIYIYICILICLEHLGGCRW